jgi:hypothetical protein
MQLSPSDTTERRKEEIMALTMKKAKKLKTESVNRNVKARQLR